MRTNFDDVAKEVSSNDVEANDCTFRATKSRCAAQLHQRWLASSRRVSERAFCGAQARSVDVAHNVAVQGMVSGWLGKLDESRSKVIAQLQ